MSEPRTPEEEAIVKLEAQNARLRSDLAALVPLARFADHKTGCAVYRPYLPCDDGDGGDLNRDKVRPCDCGLTVAQAAARRVLAAYDQEG
jgi:hypothetical protein